MSVYTDTRISRAVQELEQFCTPHPNQWETVRIIMLMQNVQVLLDRYRELKGEVKDLKYARNLLYQDYQALDRVRIVQAKYFTDNRPKFMCRKRLQPIARMLIK